ncbi:MAG TPA: IS110 family transposase [Streptosporangiaceae bacterium]
MQYARIQVLPDIPPGGVCAGIDWGSADHAVCVVDMAGRVIERFTAAHDKAGLTALTGRLRKDGAGEAAVERSDGVLVDALLAAGLTVVVITSRQMHHLRARYGAAGGKDDRFDAYVLADTLRTDRVRLRPLVPDTPATVSLRMTIRARRNLIGHRIGLCNQLRAHLAVAFPGAMGLFSDLASQVSLAFLACFSTQEAADELDERSLASWLRAVSYSGSAPASVLLARLRAAPRGRADADGPAGGQAVITTALTTVLAALTAQIKALEAAIGQQLAAHPDAHIFTSLPRAGTLRAARLLAEIGDCRARFPDAGALASLAGVTPVTRQSGGRSSRHFRWAVSRQLRDALCDFAGDSRFASPWAAQVYADARARGKDHPHATRITARAWAFVIWRCWQEGTAYDPAKHNALQRVLARQAVQANPAATGPSR